MNENKNTLINELSNALAFLGQAQELAKNSSPLWYKIGEMYDDVDNLIMSIQEGDYNDSFDDN